jgi:hypothetical protein
MKDEINNITLFCVNCNEETPHTVQYIGSYLRSVTCDNCSKKIEIDRRHLRTVFAEDFIDRLLTKPHRINEDMKKAFATLMPFFPKRLFLEPLQVFREIYGILRKDEDKTNSKSQKPSGDENPADNKRISNKDSAGNKAYGKNASIKKVFRGKPAGSKPDGNKIVDKNGTK